MSLCVFFLLSSPLRLSFVSVVFDFNDSLNGVAPVLPILLSVGVKKKKRKSELLVNVFDVSFLFSPLILSIVSVVFDFNDSLNDVVPLSPMLLSFCGKEKMKRVNC